MVIEQIKPEQFEQVWELQKSIAPLGRERQEAKTVLQAMLVSSGFRKEAHAFYETLGFVEEIRGFRKGYGEHK